MLFQRLFVYNYVISNTNNLHTVEWVHVFQSHTKNVMTEKK